MILIDRGETELKNRNKGGAVTQWMSEIPYYLFFGNRVDLI